MHLGSVYLIVNDFEASVQFYEALLQIPITRRNTNRFAMFEFEGHCIALMNAHFDKENPDKVINKGEYSDYFDDLEAMALAPNTHKFVLNFWVEDLPAEYRRLKALRFTDRLTQIKYICHVFPYYYIQLSDPDGNIIEINGDAADADIGVS